MVRKSSIWWAVLISFVAVAFIASGCAKRQFVKEGAVPQTAEPSKTVQAKPPMGQKREVTPEVPKPLEKPKEQILPSKAEGAPTGKITEEAERISKPEMKPVPLDLLGLRLQFAFDDYNLSAQSKETLDRVASWLKKDPKVAIQIQGFTCDIGTAEYNLALGDRRANSAKKYLEALGVEPSKLSSISYGEERPRVPDIDEAHRSMNRRDEFVMVK
jgi:peptidoglycan-associated lipoprotein